MATNRTNTPAAPTVVGATNDASRGGFFSRENVANLVSGAEINEVAVNNGTISITFTQTGEPNQVVEFTLNQADDDTFTIALPDGGGGTTPTPTPGSGNPVVGGEVDPINPNVLNLELMDGTVVDVDIASLATDAELNTAIDALRTEIPTDLTDLTGFPDYTARTSGDELRLNSTGDGLEFYTPQPPQPAPAAIRAGNGTSELSGTPDLTGLTVSTATNLQLTLVNDGTYVLEPIPTGPVTRPPSPIQPTAPQRAGVFDTPADVVLTYGINQGTTSEVIDDIGDIRVTASRTPTGATTPDILTPTIGFDSAVSPTTFTATIPRAESGQEGTYNVMTRVDLTDPVTMMTADTITFNPITFDRFLPFFVSGIDLVGANLPPGSNPDVFESDAVWNNIVVPPTGRPTGLVYWAAPADQFGTTFTRGEIQTRSGVSAGAFSRVGFLRAVTIPTPDGEMFTYNVYRGNVRDGFQLSNFI